MNASQSMPAAPLPIAPAIEPPPVSVGADVQRDPGRFAGITAIWTRELRGRMRGKRAFIFLTFYLGLLATILWLALRTTDQVPVASALEQISIGRGIFAGVLLIETLVVVGLAPAYTAGMITSEREKQTYDLLAVTPISSLSIVLGKLVSGLSYLGLIVLASIPIACLAFVFGGIGPEDLVRGYAVLAATAGFVGAIGIWCSAAMARSQTATVAAYIVTGALAIGVSGMWVVLDSRSDSQEGSRPPPELLLLNPFIAELDVICQATGDTCVAQQAALPRNAEAFGGVQLDMEGRPIEPVFGAQVTPPGGSFWPKAFVLYLGLAALAIFGATQSISPTRRWRPTLVARRSRTPEDKGR